MLQVEDSRYDWRRGADGGRRRGSRDLPGPKGDLRADYERFMRKHTLGGWYVVPRFGLKEGYDALEFVDLQFTEEVPGEEPSDTRCDGRAEDAVRKALEVLRELVLEDRAQRLSATLCERIQRDAATICAAVEQASAGDRPRPRTSTAQLAEQIDVASPVRPVSARISSGIRGRLSEESARLLRERRARPRPRLHVEVIESVGEDNRA